MLTQSKFLLGTAVAMHPSQLSERPTAEAVDAPHASRPTATGSARRNRRVRGSRSRADAVGGYAPSRRRGGDEREKSGCRQSMGFMRDLWKDRGDGRKPIRIQA